MKRLLALLLSFLLILSGCSHGSNNSADSGSSTASTAEKTSPDNSGNTGNEVDSASFSDPQFLADIENSLYQSTIDALNSEDYFVENVSAVYISQEYLEESAFNSQSNLYFGYSLHELDEIFQGKKYLFTSAEDGTTSIKEIQEIVDTSTETMLTNVAIGGGVILLCVTVSAVTGGAGAPAASMIFATAAKGAALVSIDGALFGGITAGFVRGIETNDVHEALDAAAMGASDGFKWGAIGGATIGGATAFATLKGATKSGLTIKEAAKIQYESKYPSTIIKQLHSFDEYKIYKNAGLTPTKVKITRGGQETLEDALIPPNLDLKHMSQIADGSKISNLQRMKKGLAPIDPDGESYELHHIGQKNDGTLAVLTRQQHRSTDNNKILHSFTEPSEIKREDFNKTRKLFWQYLGNDVYGK